MEGGMCLNGVRRRSYCIESRILSRTRPVGALHRSLQQGQSPCPCMPISAGTLLYASRFYNFVSTSAQL